MFRRNPIESMVLVLVGVFIFLVLSAASTSVVFASGGSISMANYFPADGATYELVDYFSEQTTGVNINTTVSVSIDGGPSIPMTYKGMINEIVPGDTVARDWHTWQTTVSAITASGKHTFQFFSQYYVWQQADQYWAEFNAYSAIKSFTIADSELNSKQSPQSTPANPLQIPTAAISLPAVVFSLCAVLLQRKQSKRHSVHLHLASWKTIQAPKS